MLVFFAIIRFLTKSPKDLKLIVSTLFVAFFAARGILRIINNPWYSQITIGLFVFGALWISLYLIQITRQKKVSNLNSKNIFYFTGAILIVTGAIFKAQHLPGAVSLLLSGLIIAVLSIFIGSKDN